MVLASLHRDVEIVQRGACLPGLWIGAEKFLARKPFECSYNFYEAQTFAIACAFNMFCY